MVNKPSKEIKAIWIPTAAIDDDAKAVLPKCMDDLLNAGILAKNIKTYNLDHVMQYEEITTFDSHINLTNNQAIIIEDEECYILE